MKRDGGTERQRVRGEGDGLDVMDDDVPVSFSAIGRNSSGLRQKSWSVSREEKRNRPSAPRVFMPSSYWANHVSPLFFRHTRARQYLSINVPMSG